MRLNKNEHPVGTRALIEEPGWISGLLEVVITEWAPSGKYVRLSQVGEEAFKWHAQPIVVEVLHADSATKSTGASSFSDLERRLARALLDVNLVALKRGDVALCDCIHDDGSIFSSSWLRDVLNEARTIDPAPPGWIDRNVHANWHTASQWDRQRRKALRSSEDQS